MNPLIIDEMRRFFSVFENELKSVTIRQGDSARFEAKLRLLSTSSTVPIDRSLLKIRMAFE